jgi:hypothetical protein
MKKILLTAAAFAMVGVSAIAVAPNTAQAIPAFARQTGAACYSCHFQSFPALTDFGRSFKRDAFTDVGEEALVEDDNLSIPAVLNASLVLHANYTNVDDNQGAGSKANGPGFKNGIWNLPLEAPLLIAGRVGKNMGAFGEFAGAPGGANGQAVNNWQVMSSFDMGNFRMGLNVFNTSFGWTAGIETFNVFGQHAGVLNGDDVSAVAQVGNGNDANVILGVQTQGATLWAGNDLWFASFTGWTPDVSGLGVTAQNVGFALIPAIRIAVTPQVMGWDTMIGGGWTQGTAGGANGTGAPGAFGVPANFKAAGADMWFIDAQAQGAVGNTSIGVYADYAHTKAKDNVAYNVFGSNPMSGGAVAGGPGTTAGDKTNGWSIRATVKPIPQWVFEAGYGETKASLAAADPLNVAGNDYKNKIWQIGGQYELYQNVNLKLMYEDQQIGTGYGIYAAPAAGGNQKVKTTTFELDALM